MRRFDVVIALTSPPLISFLAALFVALKGGRFCFWVMDLNPDEAIAAGWLAENSIAARALKSMLNFSLKRADRTIVLDRFMQKRVLEKGIDPRRISILPPWSHDDAVGYSSEGREEFRNEHGLSEKFLVMYSGNHSPCHPLDTLLNAALALALHDEFAFCFVGGGSEQTRVREFAQQHRLRNITCLPYQPITSLSGSLSAADLHVVVMGEKFVGIVHPCKVYNILSIRVPLLYIGPNPSHVTDIAEESASEELLYAPHGDVKRVVERIREAAKQKEQTSRRTSPQGPHNYVKHTLLPKMVALIEFNESINSKPQQTSAASFSHESPETRNKDAEAQEVVSL